MVYRTEWEELGPAAPGGIPTGRPEDQRRQPVANLYGSLDESVGRVHRPTGNG